MEIAIIGAGLSGLSCAYGLQNNGHSPVVFEMKNCIGEGIDMAIIAHSKLIGPHRDILEYLEAQYLLKLNPITELDELEVSHKEYLTDAWKKSIDMGKGYILKRGQAEDSIENQIFKKLDVSINFDTFVDIDDIKHEFEHIVIATGDDIIPRKADIWQGTSTLRVRVATVLGKFIESKAIFFNNLGFVHEAYSYIAPMNKDKGTLTLFVEGISSQEMDKYWKKFILKNEIDYTFLETVDMGYVVGNYTTSIKDNLYFIGKGDSFYKKFFPIAGVGSFNAIESGLLAAFAISKKLIQTHKLSAI